MQQVLFGKVQAKELEKFFAYVCRNTLAVWRVKPYDTSLVLSFGLACGFVFGLVCQLVGVPCVSEGLLVFILSISKHTLRTRDGVESLFDGGRDVLKDRWQVIRCFANIFGGAVWLLIRPVGSISTESNI